MLSESFSLHWEISWLLLSKCRDWAKHRISIRSRLINNSRQWQIIPCSAPKNPWKFQANSFWHLAVAKKLLTVSKLWNLTVYLELFAVSLKLIIANNSSPPLHGPLIAVTLIGDSMTRDPPLRALSEPHVLMGSSSEDESSSDDSRRHFSDHQLIKTYSKSSKKVRY